jgi:hypothetical protein
MRSSTLAARLASWAALSLSAVSCTDSAPPSPTGLLAQPELASAASDQRGLLASPGLDGQPLKAIYFFPGESAASNSQLYTAHPLLPADQHWNSDPAARADVMARVQATHANTLVMSYWGDDMKDWSPMQLDASSLQGVLDAVSGRPLVVIPAIESGEDPANPNRPHYKFADDFPYAGGVVAPAQLAPRFLQRLRDVIALFRNQMGAWAQMYDREGHPRFVVQIIHAYARNAPAGQNVDALVADAFDQVAAEISATEGIDLGFTLDVTSGEPGSYSFSPQRSGSALERAASCLAIQGFMSELYTGTTRSSRPGEAPYDNNKTNLNSIVAAKTQWIKDWIRSGVPVIYDVSSGFDGRFVWAANGTGFWGDNFDYTFDDWRNALSEQKGLGNRGLTFNTWNGFTEGYAAVPTLEHGSTIDSWLTDLYDADPRECHHVEYVDGARSHVVSGALCAKWRDSGGRFGPLGAPISDEIVTAGARRLQFQHGSVLLSPSYGAHEVHGAIHELYAQLGFETSCLGLPTSDEEADGPGRVSHFEAGDITFKPGDVQARATCQ